MLKSFGSFSNELGLFEGGWPVNRAAEGGMKRRNAHPVRALENFAEAVVEPSPELPVVPTEDQRKASSELARQTVLGETSAAGKLMTKGWKRLQWQGISGFE
jgi:hypothetical protein